MVCDASLAGVRPTIRLEEFELRICRNCESWIALPRPTARGLAGYHDSPEYFEHPYLALRRSAVAATEDRCRRIFERFQQVNSESSFDGARLLDVGCDTGNLLDAARRLYRVRPFGVDVASAPLSIAARRGIPISLGPLEAAPADFAGFDLITAIDVVEHVAEPQSLYLECARRLKPGGLLYLETPNVRSAIYGVGRLLWRVTGGVPANVFRRLFPLEHVEYYSRKGFEAVASRCRLRIAAIGTRPLPSADIAVPLALRTALAVLQAADTMTGTHALWWAVLQRPETEK